MPPRFRRCRRRTRALLVLLVVACGPFAGRAFAGDEALLVVVDPGVRTAVRLALRPAPGARLVVTAAAGPATPSVRAGVELPRLVVGPATLGGALAELANPTGAGATSDRWTAPSRLALDGALVPTSRAGLGFAVYPGVGVFAWHAGNTASVVGSARLAPDLPGRPFVDLLVSASRPLPTERAGLLGVVESARSGDEDTPLDASWFAGEVKPDRSAHALARVGFDAERVGLSGALLASLPDALMPGLGVRVSARARPLRRLEVAALATLATPDARGIDGKPLDPPARLAAATNASLGATSVTVSLERSFAPGEAAYASVGFAPERLVVADTGYRLRLAWSGRDAARPAAAAGRLFDGEAVALRSLSVDGSLVAAPLEPLGWRLTVGAGLRLLGGAVDVEPTLRVDATDGLRARLRARLRAEARLPAAAAARAAIPAFAAIATLEYARPLEGAGGAADADDGAGELLLKVQVRMTVEGHREREGSRPGDGGGAPVTARE